MRSRSEDLPGEVSPAPLLRPFCAPHKGVPFQPQPQRSPSVFRASVLRPAGDFSSPPDVFTERAFVHFPPCWLIVGHVLRAYALQVPPAPSVHRASIRSCIRLSLGFLLSRFAPSLRATEGVSGPRAPSIYRAFAHTSASLLALSCSLLRRSFNQNRMKPWLDESGGCGVVSSPCHPYPVC